MFYLAFIFGLIFGSFANVVIYRLNPALQLKSGVFGRSMCPNCKTHLKWHDLVPVLSFLWLRGFCRYCRKKISWQYPVVEILSGLIWVLVFWKIYGFNPPLIPPLIKGGLGGVNVPFLDFFYYIFIFSSLLIIAVYDFKWKIIPDKIVYPAIAVVLIFNIFNAITPPLPPLIKGGLGGVFNFHGYFLNSLFTALIAFLFFFLIFYFSSGRAMGLGDAKLAVLIALFLNSLLAVVAFTLAFIIGAAFGIMLIGLSKIFSHYKKWGMKSQIAFGPFLVLGAFIAFFFSDFIIRFIDLRNLF